MGTDDLMVKHDAISEELRLSTILESVSLSIVEENEENNEKFVKSAQLSLSEEAIPLSSSQQSLFNQLQMKQSFIKSRKISVISNLIKISKKGRDKAKVLPKISLPPVTAKSFLSKSAKQEGILTRSTAIACTDTMNSLLEIKNFLKESESEEDWNEINDDDDIEEEMDMLLKSEKILQQVINNRDLGQEMAQFLLDDDDYEEYYSSEGEDEGVGKGNDNKKEEIKEKDEEEEFLLNNDTNHAEMITPIVTKQLRITSTPTSQDNQISPSRISSSDFNLVEGADNEKDDDFDIESDENHEKQHIPATLFSQQPSNKKITSYDDHPQSTKTSLFSGLKFFLSAVVKFFSDDEDILGRVEM